MHPVAVLSRYEQNAKWASRHYEELKKKYLDEWIAILDEAVVDHDRDLGKLVRRLRKNHTENYNEIAVEYITATEIEPILKN